MALRIGNKDGVLAERILHCPKFIVQSKSLRLAALGSVL
jgi:hypothetical protein